MKKIIALALSALMVMALAACGNAAKEDGASSGKESSSQAESSQAAETTAAPTEAESTVPQSASGTTYNVGKFSVYVPEGWEAVPVPDHLDTTKTATDDIMLAKGAVYDEAQGKWNTENVPTFYITYLGKDDYARIPEEKQSYEKDFAVKDLDDVKIGDYTWHGFSLNPIGAEVCILWTECGEGGFHTSLSEAYDLTLEDKDVQAALGSLKLT